MDMLVNLYADHPFWVWMAFGAVLLAIEAATGSGWLLWAAASAGVVALVTLTGLTQAPIDITLFAVLTLATTLASRKLTRQLTGEGTDINDQTARMIGKVGRAASPFVEGHGRAFVDGSEWVADLEEGGDLAQGTRVVVTGVAGPRLKVKPA